MKRIIPIFFIIVIISCFVLPFAVSADSIDTEWQYVIYNSFANFTIGSYNINPLTIYFHLGNNEYTVYNFPYTYNSINVTTKTVAGQSVKILQFNGSNSPPNSSSAVYPQLEIYYFEHSFLGHQAQFNLNWIGLKSGYSTASTFSTGTFSDTTYTLGDYTLLYNNTTYIAFNRAFSSEEIGFYGLEISKYTQNYNLTFNSNGGSTIEPITDIEPGSTVNLTTTIGGITQYSPAFVPEREGYIFDYWYQLDYPLTPVYSITVNDDIILNAKWSNDSSLAYITFGDGFYSDINHTNALTGGYYEIGSYIDFYTYYSGSQIYRGKVAFTDLNDDVTYYQGPSGSYRYHVQITESGTFSLVLLDYCTTYVSLYPDVEGTYVSHIQYAIQDGEWHNYTFDDSLTIQPGYQLHFRFYLTAPYVITEGVYYYSLTDYENVFIRSDVKTNNNWQTFWTEVYLDFTVNHSGTLYLYVKSISDFDITSRDIVGIYDESTGEFSWAVSEVSLLDTNWEDVASNVPQNLAYMFDGIYSLSGLAIIVPLCMMVAFGLWFIRRS